MELSLWSGFFGGMAPEQAMRELAEAGFAHTELACETAVDPQTRSFSLPWMERLARASRAVGVSTPQVHYPITSLAVGEARDGGYDPEREADFAHPSRSRREFELQCALGLLALCPVAGIRIVVIHPGGSRGIATEAERLRVRDVNREVFSHLTAAAAVEGTTIALENMGRVEGRPQFGCEMRELYELVEAVASPNLGVCLDTSHARYMGQDIPEAISVLGGRLVATHVSDSLGTGDDHLLPCSGSIDWLPVLSALRHSGYRGLLNLEIPGEANCPVAILRLKARHARRLMETLLEIPEDRSLQR